MLALTIKGTTEYLPESARDQAMRRYWDAHTTGDTAAKLILVENPPALEENTDDEDPDDDPPPATPAGAVSVRAQERIQLQERWLTQAGFTLPPPLFTPGTRVVKLGEDNFRTERRRVAALPTFPTAADRVIQQVNDEKRRDVYVGLRDLSMTDTGQLTVGDQTFGLELTAFHQLTQLGGFGKGYAYLRDLCGAALRAENVNQQLAGRRNRRVVLRTRTGPAGSPQIFAAVTPTYAAVDTDQVLLAVREALTDAHTEMRYTGAGLRATALWMPDSVVDLAAGDVFKVGVRVEAEDTGRGRIRISGVAFRNLCLNLIIIGEGEVETVSLVHRGDPERILGIIKDGVERARASVANFLEAWGHARTVKVDAEETLRRWVEEKKLKAPTRAENEAIVEALLSSWRKEPGDSLADCVNAVTRAAHEAPDWSQAWREAMERQAARLVYVPR